MFEMVKIPFLKEADSFESVNLARLAHLHNWLSSQTEGASMQEIKKAISWPKADREMESFVSHQLIERDNRVYRTLVQQVSAESLAELTKTARQLSLEIQEKLVQELPLVKIHPWLTTYSVSRLKRKRFSRIVALPALAIVPVFSTCQQSGRYLFVEVDANIEPIGLANYFASTKETAKSQDLLKQIGDVNSHYFLEMAGKQLHLINDGQQPRKSSTNIFIEALKHFNYIVEAEGYDLVGDLLTIDQVEMNDSLIIIERRIEAVLTATKLADEGTQAILEALLFNHLLEERQGTKEVIMITNKKTTSR